jgi:hypothetical protein
MKKIFFLASLISLACISCKSKKDAVKSSENSANAATTASDKPVVYRLVVSFISKGAGPDGTKKAAILAYVDGHPKKPAYKTVIWGREGETDLCFNLSELTAKKDIVSFIEEVRKIAAGSDMVSVSENAPCAHKGR